MPKRLIPLIVTTGLIYGVASLPKLISPLNAQTPMSETSYKQMTIDAGAQYKLDKDACSSFDGNASAICLAQARGKKNILRAEAAAAYRNTKKARERARVAHAQAAYGVAIEKCDDLPGNRKVACVEEAEAELVIGKANAKVDRVTADTRQKAAAMQAEASKEANTDKRDAEYKVAIEKCDSLAGTATDACVSAAKTQFGKS